MTDLRRTEIETYRLNQPRGGFSKNLKLSLGSIKFFKNFTQTYIYLQMKKKSF